MEEWSLSELKETIKKDDQWEMANWCGYSIHETLPKYRSWVSFYPYGFNDEYVPVLTLDKLETSIDEYENVAFIALDSYLIMGMNEEEYTQYLQIKQTTLISEYEKAIKNNKPLEEA